MVERYVTYNTSVTAGSPNTHNVYSDLGRQVKSGSLLNDGPNDLNINIDGDTDVIILKTNEELDLTGAEIGKVVVDASAGIVSYRLLATIWDIN